MPADKDPSTAQMRLIAVVLALAGGLWVMAEAVGVQYHWPPKFIFLADLSAGAAFIWAMAATYRLWRKRKA